MTTTEKEQSKRDLPVLAKLPHEVSTLKAALCRAARGLINRNSTTVESEEMYAVFDHDTAIDACAMLLIGFARLSSSLCFRTVEERENILLVITGKRRREGEALSHRDLLPEDAETCILLDRFLRDNEMTYLFSEEGEELCLSISFRRFLADHYDLCAVNAERTGERVYRTMLLLATKKE